MRSNHLQVAISAAVAWELVPHIMDYHTEEVAKALQNILICIEMFLAAIAHLFYYDYTGAWVAAQRGLPVPATLPVEVDSQPACFHPASVACRFLLAQQPATHAAGSDAAG